MRRLVTFAVALVAALALATGANAVAAQKLNGTTGPGFTITLKQGTKKVTSLKPGKYSFVINDRSSIHNFHLRGPGVNKSTSVPRTGMQTWAITLKAGKYTFVCDPHASGMKGSFTVK